MKYCNCKIDVGLYQVGTIIKCQYCDGIAKYKKAKMYIEYNKSLMNTIEYKGYIDKLESLYPANERIEFEVI